MIDVTHERVKDVRLVLAFGEIAVCTPVRGGHLLDGGFVLVVEVREVEVVSEGDNKEDDDKDRESVEHDGSFQRGLIVLIISCVEFVLVKAYSPC